MDWKEQSLDVKDVPQEAQGHGWPALSMSKSLLLLQKNEYEIISNSAAGKFSFLLTTMAQQKGKMHVHVTH